MRVAVRGAAHAKLFALACSGVGPLYATNTPGLPVPKLWVCPPLLVLNPWVTPFWEVCVVEVDPPGPEVATADDETDPVPAIPANEDAEPGCALPAWTWEPPCPVVPCEKNPPGAVEVSVGVPCWLTALPPGPRARTVPARQVKFPWSWMPQVQVGWAGGTLTNACCVQVLNARLEREENGLVIWHVPAV